MGISVLLLSRDVEMTTQRRASVLFFGNVTMSAHCKKMNENILRSIPCLLRTGPLLGSDVDVFVNHVISAVNETRKWELCVSSNNKKYEFLWKGNRLGTVDTNPYSESRNRNFHTILIQKVCCCHCMS